MQINKSLGGCRGVGSRDRVRSPVPVLPLIKELHRIASGGGVESTDGADARVCELERPGTMTVLISRKKMCCVSSRDVVFWTSNGLSQAVPRGLEAWRLG